MSVLNFIPSRQLEATNNYSEVFTCALGFLSNLLSLHVHVHVAVILFDWFLHDSTPV